MSVYAVFIYSVQTMNFRSNYEIQGKFYFYDSDEQLKHEWKQKAKMNIKQSTFLEGILLKSMDHESKYHNYQTL